MRHRHGILRRIPVSQSGPAADLDKGGEPGEHDVDLRLVQRPRIDQRVHALIRGIDLKPVTFIVPERF